MKKIVFELVSFGIGTKTSNEAGPSQTRKDENSLEKRFSKGLTLLDRGPSDSYGGAHAVQTKLRKTRKPKRQSSSARQQTRSKEVLPEESSNPMTDSSLSVGTSLVEETFRFESRITVRCPREVKSRSQMVELLKEWDRDYQGNYRDRDLYRVLIFVTSYFMQIGDREITGNLDYVYYGERSGRGVLTHALKPYNKVTGNKVIIDKIVGTPLFRARLIMELQVTTLSVRSPDTHDSNILSTIGKRNLPYLAKDSLPFGILLGVSGSYGPYLRGFNYRNLDHF